MSGNAKHVELAREALKVLTDRGEDMEDVRHVIHYMYGGNFEALAPALRELGYEVRATVGNDGLVAQRHEVIGEDWRTTTLAGLCELADTYGVEYDGWEASMTRQPPPQPAEAKQSGGWLSKLLGKKK